MGDEVCWTKDEQELIDFLADAVSASLDVDWQPRDAARSIIAAMFDEGLCFAHTENSDAEQSRTGWPLVELAQWANGWTRAPVTVVQAFIDAGLCSDTPPEREETRLAQVDGNPKGGDAKQAPGDSLTARSRSDAPNP